MAALDRFKQCDVGSLRSTIACYLLVALFGTSGTLHFIFPSHYAAVIPPWLPAHAALVAISGACELAGAIGLLIPLTRRLAGWGLLLLCVAVFPANFQMWLDATAVSKPLWITSLLLLRLPLQIPLMMWIWYVMTR